MHDFCSLLSVTEYPPSFPAPGTVVSPLISLIEDQTRYLNGLVPGSAAMLSAGMDKRETADVYRRMRGEPVEGDGNGARLVMVLVTPEKVWLARFCFGGLVDTSRHVGLFFVVRGFSGCRSLGVHFSGWFELMGGVRFCVCCFRFTIS